MGFFTFGATLVFFQKLFVNKALNRPLIAGAYKWPLHMAIGGTIASGIEYARQRRLPYILQKLEMVDELERLEKLDYLEGQMFKDHEIELKQKLAQYRVN